MTQPEKIPEPKVTLKREPIDDGGSAFPIAGLPGFMPDEDSRGRQYPEGGMTLRDYFAAKALSGVLATDARWAAQGDKCDAVARWAYNLADAMLKARVQ